MIESLPKNKPKSQLISHLTQASLSIPIQNPNAKLGKSSTLISLKFNSAGSLIQIDDITDLGLGPNHNNKERQAGESRKNCIWIL